MRPAERRQEQHRHSLAEGHESNSAVITGQLERNYVLSRCRHHEADERQNEPIERIRKLLSSELNVLPSHPEACTRAIN